VGIDRQENRHAVARPLATSGGGVPAASQVETAACRRSYARRASGDFCSSSVNASVRAFFITRPTAEGVVLGSPLTDQFRLEGSDQLRDFLTEAFVAIDDIRFHTETGQGETYTLVCRAMVAGQPFEEAQLLRFDDEARITEITLFGRPMPALTALMTTLGPALARQQGRRGLATLLRVSAAPIHAMVTSGDRRVVPQTQPRSPERGSRH
jgi:hypothetical protein